METITAKNLVNGEFKDASNGATIEVSNPATDGELVGTVPAMTGDDVREVLEAALQGARIWKSASKLERGRILLRTAELLRERSESLVDLIVREMGKTRAEATGEVGKTAEFFDYYGGMGRDAFGEMLSDARPGTFAARITEPLGVVLLVTPWNDPLLTPARKLGPALIAGNAVVIKPASVTPLITLALAEIMVEAGLPQGVLGTVTGRGRNISDELFASEHIRAVSFTGSTEVGIDIQRKLAGRGIRVQTEMGGKNAAVIMNDADLDLAVPTIVAGAFAQAGQRCTATSRLIVQRGIAGEVRERISAAVKGLRVAPGQTPGADLGPVVDSGAQKQIQEHLETAQQEGASVIAAGQLDAQTSNIGCFVAPTFLDVSRDHTIWKNEVFGPVLAMIEVDTLEEAVEAVNDSDYGLSSAIFTKDLETSFAFLRSVDTGQVSVNQPTTGWDIHHPFGGFKDSGSGYKEQGRDALTFYTRIKTAAIRTH